MKLNLILLYAFKFKQKHKVIEMINLPKSLTPSYDIVKYVNIQIGNTYNQKCSNNNTRFECETTDYKYIINCPLKETKTIDLPKSLNSMKVNCSKS
ncbi:hypothetical protein [Candidatus Phytoplasma ziziphi]|nr:hypothetical protein [Candidatus Phytoplasma ziziphi]